MLETILMDKKTVFGDLSADVKLHAFAQQFYDFGTEVKEFSLSEHERTNSYDLAVAVALYYSNEVQGEIEQRASEGDIAVIKGGGERPLIVSLLDKDTELSVSLKIPFPCFRYLDTYSLTKGQININHYIDFVQRVMVSSKEVAVYIHNLTDQPELREQVIRGLFTIYTCAVNPTYNGLRDFSLIDTL